MKQIFLKHVALNCKRLIQTILGEEKMKQIFLKSNETMVVKGAPYNSLAYWHYSYCPFCESVENKFFVKRDGSEYSNSLLNCSHVHTLVITAPSRPDFPPDVRVIYIGSFIEQGEDDDSA